MNQDHFSHSLSANTQAILLLTAPLLLGPSLGPSSEQTPLLSLGEYKKLALHLRRNGFQPADLLGQDVDELLRICQSVIEEPRMRNLLGRGFLLSQAVTRWYSRAMWVVSRADPHYPSVLKLRLREDAPPILYGCGDISLLEKGGLAVVGSRDAEQAENDYARNVGRICAQAGSMLISGGARGIDQAAMQGAAHANGWVCEVMAEKLERAALDHQRRQALMENRLVLVSAYDPNAGFHAGHAMQRNKLIYALANAALVVASDHLRGGTWAGAVEQLEKMHLVPIYIRSKGNPSAGLRALAAKGALPWPEPQDEASFIHVIHSTPPALPAKNASLFSQLHLEAEVKPADTPADALFSSVRKIVQCLLHAPMNDKAIASALNVSLEQAHAWLQRLVDEGTLEQKMPSSYTLRARHSHH